MGPADDDLGDRAEPLRRFGRVQIACLLVTLPGYVLIYIFGPSATLGLAYCAIVIAVLLPIALRQRRQRQRQPSETTSG